MQYDNKDSEATLHTTCRWCKASIKILAWGKRYMEFRSASCKEPKYLCESCYTKASEFSPTWWQRFICGQVDKEYENDSYACAYGGYYNSVVYGGETYYLNKLKELIEKYSNKKENEYPIVKAGS